MGFGTLNCGYGQTPKGLKVWRLGSARVQGLGFRVAGFGFFLGALGECSALGLRVLRFRGSKSGVRILVQSL